MTFRTRLLGLLAANEPDRMLVTVAQASKGVLRDTRFGRCVGVNVCVSGKVDIVRWWGFAYGRGGAGYTLTSAGV